MKKMQQGFTLIELMIVIAIIGILAAIAIPQYGDYISRTQLTSALAEISGGRTAYEELHQRGALDDAMTDNSNNAATDADIVGLLDETARCSTIDVNSYASDPTTALNQSEIVCTVIGNDTVDGNIVAMDRVDSGKWQCRVTSTIAFELLPDGCSTV